MKKLTSLLFCTFLFSVSAQKLLEINVYQSFDSINQNNFSLDNIIQEYGICSLNPPLILVVIDSTSCSPWLTRFQIQDGGKDLNNYNNLGVCRQRQEKYFIYEQNNTLQLDDLGLVLSDSIKDGQLFFIYAPLNYNFTQINSLSPFLGQSLVDIWGSSAGQNHAITLFLAKKNIPSSYYFDFKDTINSEIHYSDTICKYQSASISTVKKVNSKIKQLGNNNYQISTLNKDKIQNFLLTNYLGQKISINNFEWINENTLEISLENIQSGIYFLNIEAQTYRLFKN